MSTFKQHMKDNYTTEELKDIAEYGCVSGCAGTMIYYSDTTELYNKFAEELHEVIAEEAECFGEVPQYLVNALKEPLYIFKNSIVWFVAETYANQLVNEAEEVTE